MGGVNARNVRGATQPDSPRLIGKQHHQPRPWIATGKGWFNKLPDFPATANNANGCLINRAEDASSDLYKIYLFINDVQTGWSLAGEYGQGKTGRVFYPRNLTQDTLIIEGQVANQYEYDRLAQFVSHHHMTQFTSNIPIQFSLDGDQGYPGLEFRLFKPLAGKTFDSFTPFNNVIAVTDIAAGHERFKNMPPFSMQCKVLYNHAEEDLVIWDDINRIISRQDVFGAAFNPGSRALDFSTGSFKPGSATIKDPHVVGVGPNGSFGTYNTQTGVFTTPEGVQIQPNNVFGGLSGPSIFAFK